MIAPQMVLVVGEDVMGQVPLVQPTWYQYA